MRSRCLVHYASRGTASSQTPRLEGLSLSRPRWGKRRPSPTDRHPPPYPRTAKRTPSTSSAIGSAGNEVARVGREHGREREELEVADQPSLSRRSTGSMAGAPPSLRSSQAARNPASPSCAPRQEPAGGRPQQESSTRDSSDLQVRCSSRGTDSSDRRRTSVKLTGGRRCRAPPRRGHARPAQGPPSLGRGGEGIGGASVTTAKESEGA